MFPNAHDLPPGVSERFCVPNITLNVASDLWPPVAPIPDLWAAPVLRAAMPEAAVEEDGDLTSREHDIGADRARRAGRNREVYAEP